jgi:hypothetical protein
MRKRGLSAQFGASSALHGRKIGFLVGETPGDQLPVTVALHEADQAVNETLEKGFTLHDYLVPPVDAVEAHYNGAAPISLMTPVNLTNGAIETRLAKLCPIPKGWAIHFLESLLPAAAYQKGIQLAVALDSGVPRAATIYP